jgi:hypothetical protein
MHLRSLSAVLAGLFAASLCATAQADLILQNASDANLAPTTAFAGQSLTTPAGGPWNSLTFNWLNGGGTTNPTAFGNLFLLDQAYGGTPASLSAATAGFIASAPAAGNLYTFDVSVMLQPAATYFVYTDSTGPYFANFSDEFAGGTAYQTSISSGGNYVPFATRDIKFQLNGTVVIPEPTSLLLLVSAGTVLGGVCATRSRLKKADR